MRTGVVWAALALTAVAGRAEGQKPAPVGPTSSAFDKACIDMVNGRMPQGEQAIKTLRDACTNLMSGRADERVEAERRRQQQIAAQEQLRLQAQGAKPSTGSP